MGLFGDLDMLAAVISFQKCGIHHLSPLLTLPLLPLNNEESDKNNEQHKQYSTGRKRTKGVLKLSVLKRETF